MQTAAMLFLHLFYGTNSSAKVREFCQLVLDRLQAFMPLAVSNLSLRFVSAFTSILVIHLLNLRDLGAETTDLFPKDF
jgi:hypothetical protein